MRTRPFVLALAVAGAVLVSGLARAEDPAKDAMPPVQKQIKHPFLDALVGTWNLETTGGMAGKGTATFAKGLGGTALLETYELKTEGGMFHGHGVHKLSDDQKTVTVWWFDNYVAEPLKFSGPAKDTGTEMSGDSPQGRMRITYEKKGDTVTFKMFVGDVEAMAGTYTKAK
jgi:hypothetical protein